MMLVPRRSFVPTLRNRDAFDRLISEMLGDSSDLATTWGENGFRYPALNSWEDEKNYYVEAELPGVKEKEIEISVLGNELRVSGHREETVEENKTFHRRERYVGKFERTLRFPVEIEDGKVEAKFKDGLLTITLPKAHAALPRKIEVRS